MQTSSQRKALCGRDNRRTLRVWTPGRLIVGLFIASLLAACAPQLVPTSTGHNYGKVYIGTTTVSVPVQWRNVSTRSVEVIGIGPPFSMGPQTPFAANLATPFQSFTIGPLPGGISPRFTFNFSPTRAGKVDEVGNLQLLRGRSVPFTLDGEGVVQISDGNLAVSERDLVAGEVLDFGTVVLPGGRAQREFRLTNRSGAPLTVRGGFVKGGPVTAGVQGQGPFFLVAPTPPFVLPAGGSFVVLVLFRPRAPGVFTDAITFTDANNPASTAGTSLIGRAE